MEDMSNQELLTGQGAPELGANHAANAEVGGGAIYLRGLADRAPWRYYDMIES